MKKRYIIEWIILLLVLIILIPILIVKQSHGGNDLLALFRITIRYIVPAAILLLTATQIVRAKQIK